MTSQQMTNENMKSILFHSRSLMSLVSNLRNVSPSLSELAWRPE